MQEERNHLVNFTVELWLNEKNDVLRTRVLHIQDRTETAWSGWDDQRLIEFIMKGGSLRKSKRPMDEMLSPQPVIAKSVPPEPTESPVPNKKQTILSSRPAFKNQFGLKGIQVMEKDTHRPGRILSSGQPFQVHLELDLSQVDAPVGTVFNYSAEVVSESLNTGSRVTIAAPTGDLMMSTMAGIDVDGEPLAPGLYRIGAIVRLDVRATAQPAAPRHPQMMAFLDGGVFQVY
jgi:hypothetical protein